VRTCPKEWREIRREFDWLGAKRGRQLGEVTGIGQTGVGQAKVLLRENGREQIQNRSQSVSAYAAEKFGILQPIQIRPLHTDLAFRATLLDKRPMQSNATNAHRSRARVESLDPP
jgi:hypothetical protein